MADSVAKVQPGTKWGWLLLGGIATLLVGWFLLIYPAAATAAVTLVLGWSLVFVGAIGFVAAIMNRADGGLWSGMILGVLAMVAGFLLATNVLAGTLTLTMIFIIWLLADGVVGVVLSLIRRGNGWGWWFMSSLISLVLGLMLLSDWPTSAIWLLGVYAGIMFIFRGMMLIFLSFEVKRLSAG